MTDITIEMLRARMPEENSRRVWGWWPMRSWMATQPKEDPHIAVLVGANAYNNCLHDPAFINHIEPSNKYEVIKAGVLGHVSGVPLLTDAYMHPDLRFVPDNAVIFFTATEARFYNFEVLAVPFAIQPPTGERKVYCTDPGHRYQLADGQELRFIKKEKVGDEFKTIHTGTTNEELLEVLIDRTNGLNAKLHSPENDVALHHLKAALTMFNKRTAARVLQNVEATPEQHQSAQEVVDQANALMEMASWHKESPPKEPMGDPIMDPSQHATFREQVQESGEAPKAKFPFPE